MKLTKNFAVYSCIAFVMIFFKPIVSDAQITESLFTEDAMGRLVATFIKSPNGGPVTTINLDFNGGPDGQWGTITGISANYSPAPTLTISSSGAVSLPLPSALPASGLGELIFTVNNQGANPTERDVYVKIRKALDIVLVLDRSGSMECLPANYDFPSCITSAPDFASVSRWKGLKTAVHNLTSKLVATGLTNDRISISLFDGDLKTTASGGVDATLLTGFLGLKSPALLTKVDAILDDQTQPLGRNGTAVGKGMKDAVNTKLNPADADRRRVIMLFTDGDQNVAPLVRSTGADAGKVLEESPVFVLNNGSAPDTIEKFTVGLCNGAVSFADLLRKISSNETTNAAFTTTGTEDLFGTLVSGDFFNNLFAGFSPETISETRNTIGTGFTEKIICDSTVERLFLEVYMRNVNTRLNTYRVFHRGQDVTALGRPTLTSSSILFTFNRDTLAALNIPIKGTWELRSTRLPGVGPDSSKYLFVATADDNAFHMQCDPGGRDWKVNDIIKPSVKLTYSGKPLSGAKVTALLIGTADDLPNALANEQVAPFDPSQDPNAGSLFTQKLGKVLAANPGYLDRFIEKNPSNQIVLNNVDTNGNYSGSFSKALNISGVHYLIYFIEYINGDDTIRRRERQSLVVRFGDIDLPKSNVTLTAGSAGALSTLLITPVDSRGMKIGLGYGGLFQLVAPNAKIESVKENLDGSYLISISGTLSENATLTVMDVPVYTGKLSNIGKGDSLLDKIRAWLEKYGIPEWLFWLFLILLLLFIIWLFRRRR